MIGRERAWDAAIFVVGFVIGFIAVQTAYHFICSESDAELGHLHEPVWYVDQISERRT